MSSLIQITPQNFSIPSGYNQVITFTVNSLVTNTLSGITIWWRVYEQAFGIPTAGALPLIEKTAPDITGIDVPLSFTVQMFSHDTIDLLRNYVHEATLLDELGQVIGGASGIMTVIATINR